MIRNLSIEEYLGLDQKPVLADVRSPGEYRHAHIPNAVNIALFDDEERARVGTAYKQEGREPAILLGFELTGNKWAGFIRRALELAPEKRIAVHCWRGGMRSGVMAWALDLYGFEVLLIDGGYKSYRQWARRKFATPYDFRILGGMTGSGKTRLIRSLHELGEQIIDLEDLAQHQGSAYGSMNKMEQPTQEQFENNLAWHLKDLEISRQVWVEDENKNIGRNIVPPPLWDNLAAAPTLCIEIEKADRISFLMAEYGTLDPDFLVECTQRIQKRLGPLQTTQATAAIRENRMADFIRLLLVYYDKSYLKALAKKNPDLLYQLPLNDSSDLEKARQLIEFNYTTAAEK